MKKHALTTLQICVGGLFLALFFFASNVIPPIMLVPTIPITLQILVVALMGGLLGVRAGLLNLMALFVVTAAGLPMMSSFHGGPGAFFTPTAGFIIGWFFVVLLAGLCRDLFAAKLAGKGSAGRGGVYGVLMTGFCVAGVLLDYVVGAVWFDLWQGVGLQAFGKTFIAFLIYLPFDALKCALAGSLCTAFAFAPGLRKRIHI